MKNILYALTLLALVSCSSDAPKDAESEETVDVVETAVEPQMAMYGEAVDEEGVQDVSTILAQLEGSDSVRTKVVGTIEKVCQVKGCWMSMRVNDEQSMHVSFKDYGFFVPKDIDGKETVIEGYAYIETMSVDDLKHYAEDEGKTVEEIDAITEPETNLSFVADGVIVKDYSVAEEATADEALAE